MKAALIIAHPGHELRVLKFIELFKPLVFVLTDGSGTAGKSHLQTSHNIFRHFKCEISETIFGDYLDKQVFEHILKKRISFFNAIKNGIKSELAEKEITMVFGDACEGFNPVHDICRYLINACVRDLQLTTKISNYEFLLDGSAANDVCVGTMLTASLSEQDVFMRDNLIKGYPEIQQEVEMAKARIKFPNAFNMEVLREITTDNRGAARNWITDAPFYESYGKKKIEEGKYKEVITFDHLAYINGFL